MKISILAAGFVLSLCLSAFSQQKRPDASSPSGVRIRDLSPELKGRGLFEDMGEGDTLLEVNEQKIKRAKELEEIFKDIKPGSEVKLKIQHNGKVEEHKKKTK